jgi:hypothetical protein
MKGFKVPQFGGLGGKCKGFRMSQEVMSNLSQILQEIIFWGGLLGRSSFSAALQSFGSPLNPPFWGTLRGGEAGIGNG